MAIRGFTFKGVHSDAFFIVNKVRHSMLPNINHKTVEIPEMLGALDVGIEIGMRNIEVDVTITENTTEDVFLLYDELNKWLIDRDLQEFRDDNRPNRVYRARLVGTTDLERIASYGEGTLSFVCPNPIAEGAYRKNKFTAGNYTKIEIENEGNYKLDPIIKVKFKKKTSNFKIRLNKTGDYIRVVNEFKAGDELVIDCESRKIIIRGHVEMNRLDLNSDFFSLDVGSNELETAEADSADIEINYYDKYL